MNRIRVLQSLRSRLLLSYVAVLLILLLLVGFVLLVFLATRPPPTDALVGELTAALLDVHIVEAVRLEWQAAGQGADAAPGAAILQLPALEQALFAYLSREAGTRDVRTLVVSNTGEVQFDSEGMYQPGDQLREKERARLMPTQRMRLQGVYRGRFDNPGGGEWLYIAQPMLYMGGRQSDQPFVMVAAPVPHPSLAEVFRAFGDTFFVPLAEAGLIGLLIALGLSVLISGSVARPLQRMSAAARRLALGDYRQRVNIEGPTEVRALAVSFNDMVERVADTRQAQREFLANVSHDLRTPLTSIQGFSQAIAEGVASDAESARHVAQIIHDEAARMNRMVESLLDLARIEAGRLEMRRQSVSPTDLLHAVGESVSVRARDQGLDLTLDILPDLPRIAGDGDRLAQVFVNLLDNAIKHTPPGGQVTLSARPAGQGISVTVADTGEGIPPGDLPRIFERFYQVDKSRRQGAGLGLAIVHQIIEAHGGTIRAASDLGRGSQFTVWLPLPSPEMPTISAARH